MCFESQERLVIELPDEALGAYVVNPEWTVAKIIRHILSSPDCRSSAGAEGL
ncbi:MAG: hypothetical protein F2704_04835 [Actinobacteria bacterium]|nr:hypothetical protein [Actinomycetota bacterium]MSX25197.1 hypothetical protein [Actinomycetota bacterium]MSY57573.1 hypothetical protein [Actinomycetota bacterium]MTB00873.1 hypothetical protein [Actinomycetota bacterium]